MDTVVRVAILYIFISVFLRVIGKKELSEMSPRDLVLIMLIPELATQGLNREDYSITNSVIGIATLLTLVFFNSLLTYLYPKFKEVAEGKPVVLYYQGNFVEGALQRERLGPDDILEEARAVGLETLEQVKWAILEPDGTIVCIPYRSTGTVTRAS